MRLTHLTSAHAAPILAALALGLSGCSERQPAADTEKKGPVPRELSSFKLTGQVTHRGKPLPYGYVVLHARAVAGAPGPTHPPQIAALDADGSYTIYNPQLGTAVVRVVCDPDFDFDELRAHAPPRLPRGAGGPPGGPAPGRLPPGGAPALSGAPMLARPASAEKFSADETELLKALHRKYGRRDRSELRATVHGHSDQECDLELVPGP